jgi:hypothetical protein
VQRHPHAHIRPGGQIPRKLDHDFRKPIKSRDLPDKFDRQRILVQLTVFRHTSAAQPQLSLLLAQVSLVSWTAISSVFLETSMPTLTLVMFGSGMFVNSVPPGLAKYGLAKAAQATVRASWEKGVTTQAPRRSLLTKTQTICHTRRKLQLAQ